MNLIDFLTPVELEKPLVYQQPDDSSMSRTITVHTPDHPVKDLDGFDLAIVGIPEDRSSYNTGSSRAPDKIREYLYQLRGFKYHLNIIDLGNLKPGNQIIDTYYGANEVFRMLYKIKIPVLVLGGTQDMTISNCMALKKENIPYKLTCIDRKIDYLQAAEASASDKFLVNIFDEKENIYPLDFACLGYQSYFVNNEVLDIFRNKNFVLKRLGLARSNLPLLEPELRDSHIVSVDISSVKQSDAPGYYNPSPNGFYGEELCQMARYAGLGEKVSSFGIFEVNPKFDNNHQTSHLAAQISWYFIDGLANRAGESPEKGEKSFKKFIVANSKLEQQVIFYKSIKTNRWWMAVPSDPKKNKKNHIIISCSALDYEVACNDEIPDRWLDAFHRFN